MLAIEGEEIGMLEIAQPIDAVMTGKTAGSILLGMVRHKSRIVLVMAIDTGLQIKALERLGVASTAGYGLVVIIYLMSY